MLRVVCWGYRFFENLLRLIYFSQLGIQKMTPDGLLLGATSIVSQNKQLRKEMTDLEREITTLRQQNKAMVCVCVCVCVHACEREGMFVCLYTIGKAFHAHCCPSLPIMYSSICISVISSFDRV